MGFSFENLNSQDSPLFSALKIYIRKIPRYSRPWKLSSDLRIDLSVEKGFQPWKIKFARFPAILSLEHLYLQDSRLFSALKVELSLEKWAQPWKLILALRMDFSLENLNSQESPLFSALKKWIRKIPRYSQPWKNKFARLPATLSLEKWAQPWKMILELRMGFSLENLNSQFSPLFSALKIWIRKIPRYSQLWFFTYVWNAVADIR